MFNNKQEYLTWRSEWLVKYEKCSETIRQMKLDFKDSQRHNEHVSILPVRWKKNEATEMLENLKIFKTEAQRQYLESKKA
jgi:hypothetical protein